MVSPASRLRMEPSDGILRLYCKSMELPEADVYQPSVFGDAAPGLDSTYCMSPHLLAWESESVACARARSCSVAEPQAIALVPPLRAL